MSCSNHSRGYFDQKKNFKKKFQRNRAILGQSPRMTLKFWKICFSKNLLVYEDLVKIIKNLGIELLVAEKSHLKSLYGGIFGHFHWFRADRPISGHQVLILCFVFAFRCIWVKSILHSRRTRTFQMGKNSKKLPCQTSLAILILSLVFRYFSFLLQITFLMVYEETRD